MSDRVLGSASVPEEFGVPDENLGEFIWKTLDNKAYESKLALVEVDTGKCATYGELRRRAELVARRLLNHGCRRGDVIAFFSPNSISFMVVWAAALRIGAVPATINSVLTVGEVNYNLQICRAKYIFTTFSLASAALQAAETATSPVSAVFVSGSVHPGCVDIESAPRADEQLPRLPYFDSLSLGSNDPFMILFSSGTTGLPKGAVSSQRSIRYMFAQFTYPKSMIVIQNQLVFVPFAHGIGLFCAIFGLAKGVTTLFMAKFCIENYLKAIHDNQIDHVVVVPSVATMMAKSAESSKYNLSCLKDILSMGAPMSADIENQLMTTYPGVTVRQVYGLTEGGLCTHVPVDLPQDRRAPGTVGIPFPATLIKVVDLKTGKSLGPRAAGEICVKSPSIMFGYVDNPRATADLFDSDGWLHTGDIGYYDDHKNFFIVDRLKELIKYKANQVPPAELEAVLLSHPQVADAGVVGLPDPAAGELPLACVVKKPNATVTEAELQQFVSDRVAPYMKLRGGVQFVSSIPKTVSGKLLRRLIKEAILKSHL